jgi:hypothetical protein
MRWILVGIESLATGALAVVVLVILFFTCLSLYSRYLFGPATQGAVGWDVVSLFGQHWKVTISAILVGTFLFGTSFGFWLFGQRAHR